MRISIIVPTLNEATGIEHVLIKWQYLRQAGHQIIVADGGSTDDTVALAEPLADQIVSSESGRALQMNTGAASADGELLWFVHADTGIPCDAVYALCVAWQSHHGINFWGRFDVRLDENTWPYRLIGFSMNQRSRLSSVSTGDQGLFVCQQLFRQCGGFAQIELMEDIEICKRLRRISAPANLSVQLITSSRRWKTHGWLSTVLLMWCLRFAYFCGVPADILSLWYDRNVR